MRQTQFPLPQERCLSVTLGLRAPHGATAELPLGVLGTGGWTAPRSRWRSWLSGPADRTQPSGGPAGSAGVQPDSDFAAADRRRPADVRWSGLWSPGGSSRSPGHRRRHQGSLCPTVATPHGPALRDPVTHRTQSRAQGSHPLSTRGRSIWHTPGLPKPLRGCPPSRD